jgi:hypothetical protein
MNFIRKDMSSSLSHNFRAELLLTILHFETA